MRPLAECWQEIAERVGMTNISVQNSSIGQKIGSAADANWCARRFRDQAGGRPEKRAGQGPGTGEQEEQMSDSEKSGQPALKMPVQKRRTCCPGGG